MQTPHNAALLREAINYDKYKSLLDRSLFDAFLDMDPTKDKKYAAWIILWFMKGFDVVETVKKVDLPEDEKYPMSYGFLIGIHNVATTNPTAARRISRFLREDHYKVTEDLEAYDKLKRKKALGSERDYNIMNVFGFDTLADMIAEKATVLDNLSDEGVKPEDYEKWYEDDDWLVVVPLTIEASQKYGANTKWCTAARDLANNAFNDYAPDGPLIIFIDKKDGRKWQVHRESDQWMDARDRQVEKNAFVTELPSEVKEAVFERTRDIRFSDDQMDVVVRLLESPKVRQSLQNEISPGSVCGALSYGDEVGISDRIWAFGVSDYSVDRGLTYESAYSYGMENPGQYLDEDPADGDEWSEDQRTAAGIKAEEEAEAEDVDNVVSELSSNYNNAVRSYGSDSCQDMVSHALDALFNVGTPMEIAMVVIDLMTATYYDYSDSIVDCVNEALKAEAIKPGVKAWVAETQRQGLFA